MAYKIKETWLYRPHGIIFPEPILDKIETVVPLKDKKVLHLFSGKSKFGDTCDVNNTFEPTFNIDCSKELPFEDESYDIVLTDPPYYDGHSYGTKPYSFIKEASRVLKVGGYLLILHPLRYTIPKGMEGHALIGISTGPNLKARWLNIFHKMENIKNKEVKSNQSMREMV